MVRRSVVAGAVVALLACGSAFGQAVPKEMAWTAYDTGSSGFNIAVAIGQQFKQAYQADVRILPSGNDTGRLAPVKASRALLSQMGIGTYFAQEGVFEFGTKSWGPQPTRLMMAATACNGITLAVAKDTSAGGLSPQSPIVAASYAYPIFMTYADRPAEPVYDVTKGMIDTDNAYKDGAPGAEGMALSLQNFEWVVPYHDGAIRAFKEKGVWTDAAQKHNDALIKRQQVMMDTWKSYSGSAPSDDKAFAEGWMKARSEALKKAGLDVIFE
jgi:hypothetical protein